MKSPDVMNLNPGNSILHKSVANTIAIKIIIIIVLSCYFISCNLNEEQVVSIELDKSTTTTFFTKGYIESTNPSVIEKVNDRSTGVEDEVYQILIEQNEEYNFVPYIVDQYGYPAWSYTDYALANDDSTIVAFTPLLFQTGDQLSGVIVTTYTNSYVDLSLISRFELENLIPDLCESVAVDSFLYVLGLHHIEQNVFGASNLTTDSLLYSCLLEEATSNLNSVMERDAVAVYLCFQVCTDVSSGSAHHFNLGGWLCNLWFDLFHSCPNPHPQSTSSGHSTVVCNQWESICYWVIVNPGDDYPDHQGTGAWWNNPNFGPRPPGGPNPPTINLGPHLLRIEACGGLGDPYDYGPSNPSGQHPDQIFCEQLQELYQCLPFLAADDELIAWYLWYDATYPGDTWTSLYNFGCASQMSPTLKEEGIRLFENLLAPGSAYPPFNNDWEVFLDRWVLVASLVDHGIVLSAEEKEWLTMNPIDLEELNSLVEAYKPYTEEFIHIQRATSIFLLRSMNPITITEEEAYESVIGASPPGVAWALAIRGEYLSLKLAHCLHTYSPGTGQVTFSNCEWSESRLQWTARLNVLMEGFHAILQIAGFVPGVGEIADLTDGIIYSIEGDGFNAWLSFAATIPIAGWGSTATRFATRTITGPSGRTITFKYLRETASSFVTFGDQRQLRRVLGLAKGNPLVAHHLIPWGQSGHELVQKAAKSTDLILPDGTILKPWHMNDALNGIPLDYTVHNGSHTAYSNTIRDYMTEIINTNPSITNEQALFEIKTLTTHIRDWIASSPGVHIDYIVLP